MLDRYPQLRKVREKADQQKKFTENQRKLEEEKLEQIQQTIEIEEVKDSELKEQRRLDHQESVAQETMNSIMQDEWERVHKAQVQNFIVFDVP